MMKTNRISLLSHQNYMKILSHVCKILPSSFDMIVVGIAVINNMLKIHDNIPHIKEVNTTRVKHKCFHHGWWWPLALQSPLTRMSACAYWGKHREHPQSMSTLQGVADSSAAEIWSPGRQLRPMNQTGDPRSYHGWSIRGPMNSLCFAKNILEETWTDNSADALISYSWFNTRLQYLHC